MEPISGIIQHLAGKMQKLEAEEPLDTPPADEPVVEEKDQETLIQEHVKNNMDKYKQSFESLFPTTQMVVKNIEYRGMILKDKIRVMVDFEAVLLNFDALQVLSDKEIGIEATGEKTFRVYNIYLPKVKDATIKSASEKLNDIASDIQAQDPVIAMAIDKISETIEAAVTLERLITKVNPDHAFSIKDLKNITKEDIAEAQNIINGKPGMSAEAGINPKALMLAIALLAAGFNQANAQNAEKIIHMPTVEIKGQAPTRVQMELQKNFPNLFQVAQAPGKA